MSKKVTHVVAFLLIILAIFSSIEISSYNYERKSAVKKLYPVPSMYQRVLIIAPHPDDETLAAGGLIQDTIKYGGEVKVVVMTNGDSFTRAVIENYNIIKPAPHDFLRLGYERQKETISALKYLGVKEKNIIFLGYPDKGLAFLWWKNFERTLESPGIKKTHSPYINSYSKGTEYKGENVLKDLKSIIKEYNPTLVIYPHPNELHPDHWATNSFVKYTLYTLKKDQIPQFLYIVHRTDWPLPLGKHPHLNLNPPKSLLKTGTEWHLYPLSEEEVDKKGKAITMYKTQMKVMKDFLLAFDRKTELYGFYRNGTLRKYSKNLNFEEYKIILDPERDNLRDYENGSADITAVYGYIKTDILTIAIKCRNNAKKEYEYHINAILFKDHSEIGRINVIFKNGKISFPEGKGYIKNGIVYISIPVNKDFDAIYLSVFTTSGKKLIDKTAWRLLEKEK